MDDLTPADLARFADYLAGELTPAEAIIVERWIEESPERQHFVETLQRSRIDLDVSTPGHITDLPSQVSMLSQSLANIWDPAQTDRTSLSTSPHSQYTPPQRSWFHRRFVTHRIGYTVGAFVAGLMLVFAGWHLAKVRYGGSSPSSVSTYTTGNGERATVTLPDGSTILMNVASRIQVPTNYSAGNRTVQLTGEAFFTVAPRPGAPFTVVSGPSTTRVLGTTFVVRHYETDTAAIVAVRDGKVAVGSTVLTAAQATSVTASGSSRVVPAESRQFGFANGVLEFNYTRFPEAIPELNRWYNAEIRLGDSTLVNQRIVGSFDAGSLTDLVAVLEFTFNVRVVRDGRILTLYKGR